jgi:hypothetical protein
MPFRPMLARPSDLASKLDVALWMNQVVWNSSLLSNLCKGKEKITIQWSEFRIERGSPSGESRGVEAVRHHRPDGQP